MTNKLRQEAILHEFDAEGYSLSGKPLGVDRILIVRMDDGRARCTSREPDGSIALGQLQLGAAAAKEILRLQAAAAAREQEIEGLRNMSWQKVAERDAEIADLRARVAELEAWKGKVPLGEIKHVLSMASEWCSEFSGLEYLADGGEYAIDDTKRWLAGME